MKYVLKILEIIKLLLVGCYQAVLQVITLMSTIDHNLSTIQGTNHKITTINQSNVYQLYCYSSKIIFRLNLIFSFIFFFGYSKSYPHQEEKGLPKKIPQSCALEVISIKSFTRKFLWPNGKAYGIFTGSHIGSSEGCTFNLFFFY